MGDKFSANVSKLSRLIEKVNKEGLTMSDTNAALKIIQILKTSKDFRANTFTNTYKFTQAERFFNDYKKNFVPPRLSSRELSNINDGLDELREIAKSQKPCSSYTECVCILKNKATELAQGLGNSDKEAVDLLLEGAKTAPCDRGSLKKKRKTKRKKSKSKSKSKSRSKSKSKSKTKKKRRRTKSRSTKSRR